MRVPAGPDAHRRHVPSAECLLRTLCHRRLCSYLLSSCASSSSRKGQRQVKLCTRKWVTLIQFVTEDGSCVAWAQEAGTAADVYQICSALMSYDFVAGV